MLHDVAAAFRLLTRIPMPSIKAAESSADHTAQWFPLVGLVIGLVLFAAALLMENPPIAALMLTLFWVAITGGMHLDGAADLADGLGAAHGDQSRLLTVMKDPHIGTFGALMLIVIMMTKWVALAALVATEQVWALLLIPAWARLGVLYWMRTLQPLGDGLGAKYCYHIDNVSFFVWIGLLSILTVALASPFFIAAVCAIILGWRWFLHYRVGGMNGDCLGAGIELCECALLLMLVVTP
ncbi:MAG: adenosylcobinamide-GDP ribazoletransferase [Mariprofundales bacterium]